MDSFRVVVFLFVPLVSFILLWPLHWNKLKLPKSPTTILHYLTKVLPWSCHTPSHFSVLLYCLTNKANTTFIYKEKSTSKLLLSSNKLHFSKSIPFFMSLFLPTDTLFTFSTYPNSTYHLRLSSDIISTMLLALILSRRDHYPFLSNLTVHFEGSYHTFYTLCAKVVCLTLLWESKQLEDRECLVYLSPRAALYSRCPITPVNMWIQQC